MMQIIAWILSSLAMGGFVFVLMMQIMCKQICDQRNSLSEYYFDAQRRPSFPFPAGILSKIFSAIFLLLLFLAIYFLFFILFSALNDVFPGAISQIAIFSTDIQNMLNIMIPALISVVIFFGTFKKSYYVLFSTHDITKQLYPWMLSATVSWMVCYVLFAFGKVTSESEIFGIFFYSAIIPLLILCCLSCIVILINSCRIILTNRVALQLLDALYKDFAFFDGFLPRINEGNIQNMDTTSNYLIERLVQNGEKVVGKLKKFIGMSAVEFWDAANEAPQARDRQMWPPIVFLIVFSSFMGFGIVLDLYCFLKMRDDTVSFSYETPSFIISFSIVVLYTLAHLLASYPPLYQMRRAVIYGRWGYLFSDEAGTPQCYIPRYPLYAGKVVKWFRALLNVLTLCRIECVNNCTEDLLKKLHDTLSETKTHTDKLEEEFVFTLAYYLCLNLAQGVESPDEHISDIDGKEVLHDAPHKELLISWADAIWIDMKRDMDWYREKYGSAEPVAAATPGT